MQPGHEEVAPELEELLIEELLDESSFFAQEMTVRLKGILKLCIKLYSYFSFTSNERK